MDPLLPPFPEALRLALRDDRTRHNLQDVIAARQAMRAQAWSASPRIQRLSEQARRSREHTAAHLSEQLALLSERAQGNGFHVFQAATSADAVAHIVGLLRDARPRSIAFVQGEVLDEIGLWRALQEAGLHTVDVDMAAYLLRAMGDLPAHPVVPLGHLSVRDMTALWEEITGHALRPQPEALVNALRNRIMPTFERADVGILPATFAVAETGGLIFAEDESHVAKTLAHASTLIVIMSIDRIVERWVDVGPLLEVRNRHRAGETLPRHTVVLRSPDAGLRAKEIHLVLVDNGRSRWAEWGFSEALMCIGCGACADVSPVMHKVGGQVYNSPYMGGIGAVISSLLWPDTHGDIARLTPPCSSCRDACPLDIPIDELHRRIRARLPRPPEGSLARLVRLMPQKGQESPIEWEAPFVYPGQMEHLPDGGEQEEVRSPLERLVRGLVARGIAVYRAESAVAARLHLAGVLNAMNISRVIGWDERDLELPGLRDALEAVGIAYIGPGEAFTRQGHLAPAWTRAAASIVVADAAVAESAALVLSLGRQRPLAALTNARTLFVLVPAGRLFPTWQDWERAWAGNLVIVRGPTRTLMVRGKEVQPGMGVEHIHAIVIDD